MPIATATAGHSPGFSVSSVTASSQPVRMGLLCSNCSAEGLVRACRNCFAKGDSQRFSPPWVETWQPSYQTTSIQDARDWPHLRVHAWTPSPTHARARTQTTELPLFKLFCDLSFLSPANPLILLARLLLVHAWKKSDIFSHVREFEMINEV